METPNRTVTTAAAAPAVPAWRTVSWPAVFAGVVLAFMVMAILNMLAFGIGINSIDLTGDSEPFRGLGAGLGWSMVVINVIAYAVGGYVAGRLAGPYRHGRGFLHGLLSWAVLVLVSAWLLTSAAGTVLGGIGNILSAGGNLLAQGVGALAPAVSQGVEDATADVDVSGEEIRAQLSDLLMVGTDGPTTNPALAEIQVQQLVRDAFSGDEELFSPENREAVSDLLVEETDLTPAEAEEVVSGWEDNYAAAQQRLEQMQAELTATAEDAQAAIASSMLWGAIALIVIALVSGWAGGMGANARRTVPAPEGRRY